MQARHSNNLIKNCDIRPRRRTWLKTNITYGLVGLGLGLIIYLMQSALANTFKPAEYLMYNILFSMNISLTIANMVHFAVSTKILHAWENIWRNFIIYYAISFVGLIIAVELTYFVLSYAYNRKNSFPHVDDYLFDSILVLVVCTANYVHIYRRTLQANKLQQKELELHQMNELRSNAELSALQAKINPHFLYNALNSIAGLIKENPNQAEDMTIKLAKLFRQSINQNQQNLVNLKEEIELLDVYLEIEKVRFGDRIKFVFDIQEGLDSIKIPRFLIQPLVENALKHGLNHKASDGYLRVAIFRDSQHLLVQVIDNGEAFAKDLALGYGLESTFNKIKLLYGEAGQVALINKPEKMIQIKMPLPHA